MPRSAGSCATARCRHGRLSTTVEIPQRRRTAMMSIVACQRSRPRSAYRNDALPRTSAGPGPIGARVTSAQRGLQSTGQTATVRRLSPGGRRGATTQPPRHPCCHHRVTPWMAWRAWTWTPLVGRAGEMHCPGHRARTCRSGPARRRPGGGRCGGSARPVCSSGFAARAQPVRRRPSWSAIASTSARSRFALPFTRLCAR